MTGAVPSLGAADQLWTIQSLLDDARCGRRPPAFLLSLDQEKCFDRLHIDMLREIVVQLGLPGCEISLNIYACLSRLLFVDGQPSDVSTRLHGDGTTGIPQGCPLACFFCNLTAIA